MIDEKSFEEFKDLIEDLRDEFYNQIDFGTAVTALGSRWLLLLTLTQIHLLSADDDSKDIVLLVDEIETSLRLASNPDSMAELAVSGIADFSIYLPNSEALVLKREIDYLQNRDESSRRTRYGAVGAACPGLDSEADPRYRSAIGIQNLAIGVGLASLLLHMIGAVPFIALALSAVSWQRSAAYGLSWTRPLIATTSSLIGFLFYLSFYGHL